MGNSMRRRIGGAVGLFFAVLGLVAAQPPVAYPGKQWAAATPAEARLDAKLLDQARDYALGGGGSGYITRHGLLVMSWGDVRQTYDLKSSTKSFGATAAALAMMDGKLHLSDRAVDHHPSLAVPPHENKPTGWIDKVTIEHLLTQTAGFEKPGGYGRLLFEPGTMWFYSDAGPNWLAECVTLAYRRDVRDLMFERVFEPIGITPADLRWRNNQYREHMIEGVPRREFGSGIHANVDAMARLGYLYLRGGRWIDRQIIPAEFVDLARRPRPWMVGLPEYRPRVGSKAAGRDNDHGNASDHYGLLWWNNADGALEKVPRDTYWTWGLYDSMAIVIPSLDIVVSRAGKSWQRQEGAGHYDVLAPFLEPIARAAID
jgi:CubicO group peptidase (beta-lactamase class C family)